MATPTSAGSLSDSHESRKREYSSTTVSQESKLLLLSLTVLSREFLLDRVTSLLSPVHSQ